MLDPTYCAFPVARLRKYLLISRTSKGVRSFWLHLVDFDFISHILLEIFFLYNVLCTDIFDNTAPKTLLNCWFWWASDPCIAYLRFHYQDGWGPWHNLGITPALQSITRCGIFWRSSTRLATWWDTHRRLCETKLALFFYITNTCFYFECQRDRRTATLSKYLFLLSVLHKECLTFVVWPRKSRLRSASPECGGLGPEPRSTLPLQKIWANSVNFDYGVQSFLVEGFQKMPHRAWTDGPAFHSDLWVFGKSHGINTSWCKPIVKHRALFPSW